MFSSIYESPTEILIKKEINSNNGKLSFAQYMDICLTNSNSGYYSTKDLAWNRFGDYQTSPEVHYLFGYLWAQQIYECLINIDKTKTIDLIEIGGGSGVFMANIANWLKNKDEHIFNNITITLIDVSKKRLSNQKQLLESFNINASYMTLDDFINSTKKNNGVIITNEFFDCLPVNLIKQKNNTLYEIYVVTSGKNKLEYSEQLLEDKKITNFIEKMNLNLFNDCIVEIPINTFNKIQKIAEKINSGYFINIDYGDVASNLIQPWRKQGTYKAITRHMIEDPLVRPGEIDITADVNFSLLQKALEEKNMIVNPIITQWEALSNLGIFEIYKNSKDINVFNSAEYLNIKKAIETLTEPEKLGKIKVQIASRSCPINNLSYLRKLI
ncbi:MAG: SAM-dependent methyltransferase, MidA family [Chloroflexi bacterium]|nr:MAG: SAM-dependent methyltransferase, MidA family [Chloroflexota bacterium]